MSSLTCRAARAHAPNGLFLYNALHATITITVGHNYWGEMLRFFFSFCAKRKKKRSQIELSIYRAICIIWYLFGLSANVCCFFFSPVVLFIISKQK